ncbi:MAG: tetratricopeptide repeat protein [Formivibrio sp.]|nr:tetratricopeptide repeat protein [Formivibrio sp.]
MKTKKVLFPIVCCIPFLSSCSSVDTAHNATWELNPVYSINQMTDSPTALYQLGRYYQGQKRYDQAATAYLRALAANSNFVEAHNGLGVVYAMQGRYEEAISAFRTAISLAPEAAHLRNNLGYVLYLQGSYTEAVSTLEKAAQLDPTNLRTMSNLTLASAKSDNPEHVPVSTATAEPVEATTIAQTAPAEPAALAQEQWPEPPLLASHENSPLAATKSHLETVQLAPNVYELRERVMPAQLATAEAIAPQPVAAPTKSTTLRLEVSNGNGITGFARKVSGFLVNQGYRSARLTNQKPFQVSISQIQYRPGFRDAAQNLKSSLPPEPNLELVQTNTLRADIQARILLGKDMSRNVAQYEPVKQKTAVAFNSAGADIPHTSAK